MHPKISVAEIEVFKALSAEGLTGGLVTQNPIILKSTVPDFCWLKHKVVFFWTAGKYTHPTRLERRDEEIDNLLELQGWDVLRIVYDPPLTAKALEVVMAQVKDFLREAS